MGDYTDTEPISEEPNQTLNPSLNGNSPDLSPLNQNIPEEEDEEDEELNPDIIPILGNKLLDQDYDIAVEELKEIYEKSTWSDKQKAAENFSVAFDNLNRYHDVKPDPDLQEEMGDLAKVLLDSKVDEDTKLDAIEKWREQSKINLYNTDSADRLVSGDITEKTIDAYAVQFRRDIVAKDTPRILDMISRGAEDAVGPLVGVTDFVLGTEYQKSFRESMWDYQNPDYDESILSIAASGVGTVGGFVATSFNPYTAWGYLGATLIDQGKMVYDQAYEATNSHDAAMTALLESSPGVAISSVAHKIIGGSLGAAIRGKTGYVNALEGAAAGAGGFVAESYAMGAALTDVTGDEQYTPTTERLAKEALVGAAIGGIAGGARDLGTKARNYHEARLDAARKEMQRKLGAAEEVVAENEQAAIYSPEQNPAAMEFVQKGAAKKPEVKSPKAAPKGKPRAKPKETTVEAQKVMPVEEAPIEVKEGAAVVPESAILDPVEAAQVQKVFSPPVYESYTPSPLIVDMVRQLGAKPELIDMFKYWGFLATPDLGTQAQSLNKGQKPPPYRLAIARRLFRSPNQAEKTLTHEFGHLIDAYSRTKDAQTLIKLSPDRQESVAIKLLRFNKAFIKQFDNKVFNAEAEALSKIWRPGWDHDPKYRGRPTEIQADIISAIFQSPEWVRENFPQVFRAFELGLKDFPEVRDFWNKVQNFAKDPELVAGWVEGKLEEGRLKQGEVHAKVRQKQLEEKAAKKKALPKDAVTDTMTRIINRFHFARDIVNDLIKEGFSKEKVYALYNTLYNWNNAYKTVEALLDEPLARHYKDYLKLGIPGSGKDPYSTWKNYERANWVLNDSNALIEDIYKDPGKYKRAVNDINAAVLRINNQVKNKKNELRPIETDLSTYHGEQLVHKLSQIHVHKYWLPTDRFRIRRELGKQGKAAAISLLEDDAFNVRRFMANPVMGGKEAQKELASLRQRLGAERYAELEKFSREWHAIFGSVRKALDEAGLLTPKLKERIDINKDSYVTTNVLKYFEEDAHIPATLRAAHGTLDEIGDEIVSTEMKSKSLMVRAELQKAVNAMIELADHADIPMREVEPTYNYRAIRGKNRRIRKSVYEQKDAIQKKNPDKSYLVGYEEGVPTLYEFDSPDIGKMFEGSKVDKIPVIGAGLRAIEAANRYTMVRESKTIFSLPFTIASKFYDTAQEAVIARAGITDAPGLWFHTNKQLRDLKRRGKDVASLHVDGGIIDPLLREMIENQALPYLGAEAFMGRDITMEAYAAGVYKAMGIDLPGEASVDRSLRVSMKLNNFMEKVPTMKWTKKMAMRDELATKVTGYLIAKEIRGMGPQQAALMAREYFGTPDPSGGGIEAANINKLFLFGRAHINGMRSVVNQFKEGKLGYTGQYVYRKLFPRLITSGAIIAPLIGAFTDENTEKVYKKFCDKLSSYDKMSKYLIPMGFMDEKGNWRGFNVNADDVNHEWKAITIRAPMSRDLIAMDQLATPAVKFLEELLETGTISGKHIAENVAEAFSAVVGGSTAPPVQWARNIKSLMTGQNPQDYFRGRGILPRDVQEAGGFVEKFYTYLAWAAYNQYPAWFNFKYRADSTEPTSVLEWLSRIPQAGRTAARFVNATNYGDYERFKELERQKVERDAEIRLGLGDNSRRLYNEYRKTQAIISKLGKEWREEVSPDFARRVHMLNHWNSHVYRPMFNELRSAFENGDDEEIELKRKQSEKLSQRYITHIK